MALPLFLSSTDIVGMTCYLPSKSPWYVVFFVKASWWGDVLHQDNVKSKAALLPAGVRAVVLNQPRPVCKAACVTQKYLAILHTSGFLCVHSLKSLQADYQKIQSIRNSITGTLHLSWSAPNSLQLGTKGKRLLCGC